MKKALILLVILSGCTMPAHFWPGHTKDWWVGGEWVTRPYYTDTSIRHIWKFDILSKKGNPKVDSIQLFTIWTTKDGKHPDSLIWGPETWWASADGLGDDAEDFFSARLHIFKNYPAGPGFPINNPYHPEHDHGGKSGSILTMKRINGEFRMGISSPDVHWSIALTKISGYGI